MSSTPSAPATSPPPQPTPAAPSATSKSSRARLLKIWVLVGMGGVVLIVAIVWWSWRLGRSVTEDAFVEAHIVNVAPQAVSGHLVSYFVEENDRVEKDQLLAEIDAEPYRDQVNLGAQQG